MALLGTSAKRTLHSPGAAEALDRLKALGEWVAEVDSEGEALAMVSSVSEVVERVSVEHVGMAEELLEVYEQLGAVFEVTRKLPTVRRESEVVGLFVDTLRRTFSKREVFTAHPPSLDQQALSDSTAPHGEWVETLVRRACDRRSVLVENRPDEGAPNWVVEAMVGPIFAGTEFVSGIVLFRGAEAEPFRAADMLLLESLTMFCGDLIGKHRMAFELQEMSINIVRSLVKAVDQKDEYTSGHSLRVAYCSTLLGKAIGLEGVDLVMLQWGALLHDVGKIGIRDDVLKKTGRLTEAEFNHIKEHPVRSHKVVEQVPQLRRAREGVLHHHEHYDGSGYPAGLAGEAIPLQARIIQVADVFDALTSTRSYRSAFHWRKALDILKEEAGKAVDPKLQQTFDRIMRETLEGKPDAWEKMVQRGNEFTQVAGEFSGVHHGF